jgi:adenylyltransferase/sulfurtransferase
LPQIGAAGQASLQKATVAIVGCGGLGSAAGEILARAGVGKLILIDRDVVELNNLQRQLLYTEADAQAAIPKAEAMKKHLAEINQLVQVSAHVLDLNYRNAIGLLQDADVIVDGTDNYLARLLLNDVALTADIPWVYGGAIGVTGMVMPVIPGKTPCFRCLLPDMPEAGQVDSCDLVGVLGSVTVGVAALQASTAIRLLLEGRELPGTLLEIDVWNGAFRQLDIPRDPDCPACVHGQRQFLQGVHSREAVALCGRDTAQVWPAEPVAVDFARLGKKLASLGRVEHNRFTLRFFPQEGDLEITLFGDGRAMIKGTTDSNRALSVYSRYFG